MNKGDIIKIIDLPAGTVIHYPDGKSKVTLLGVGHVRKSEPNHVPCVNLAPEDDDYAILRYLKPDARVQISTIEYCGSYIRCAGDLLPYAESA